MPEPPDAALLARASDFLAARMGLHLPPERWGDMARALAEAAPEAGGGDARRGAQWLLSSPPSQAQLEILASHLTIGETYFFREPAAFAALRQSILPPLIASRRQGGRWLRLWSAGCASGEEAYSIAIELARLLPDLDEWQITLLATDINPRFLATATRGVYGDWSFRDNEPGLKEGYFRRCADGRYALLPRLKALVSFAHLNLVDDNYPPGNSMDIIFCRNVLMYFRPEHAAAVLEKLARCLTDGGWLVLGAVEAPLVARPELEAIRLPGSVFHRKKRPAPPPPPPSATAPPPAVPSTPAAAPSAAAQAARARSEAGRGRPDEALAWCRRALDSDKLNPAWNYLHATILLELGETAAAASALRRTLYLDHHCVMAHFTLGQLMARQGKLAAARRHYRNTRELLAELPPQQLLAEGLGLRAGQLGAIVAAALAEAVSP